MLIETGIVISATENGTGTDISSWIVYKGINWSRKDVDGGNGGIMLDGSTTRDVLANKVSLEITTIPLPLASLRTLQTILLPVSFWVTYDDPLYGEVTKNMYCQSAKASSLHIRAEEELWEGITFTLEEI